MKDYTGSYIMNYYFITEDAKLLKLFLATVAPNNKSTIIFY